MSHKGHRGGKGRNSQYVAYGAGWGAEPQEAYSAAEYDQSETNSWCHALQPLNVFSEGDEVSGAVTSVTNVGVFVNFGCVKEGLLPLKEAHSEVDVGELFEHLVISKIDLSRNRVSLRNQALNNGHSGRNHGKGMNGTASRDTDPWGAWQSQEVPARKETRQSWDAWSAGWDDDQWWSAGWNGDTWDSGEQWQSQDWRDEGACLSSGSRSGAKEEKPQAEPRSYYDTAADANTMDGAAALGTSMAPPRPLNPGGASMPLSRADLISAVFKQFDVDRDGYLASAELRAFATNTGFEGPDAEWQEEYGLLCRELGCSSSRGLDEPGFTRMVNDDSEQGCYCADEELAGMLQPNEESSASGRIEASPDEAWQQPSTAPAPVAPSPTVTAAAAPATQSEASQPAAVQSMDMTASRLGTRREDMKAKIFRILDRDSSGYLKSGDLRVFAEHTGFSGDENAWYEEYLLLCNECYCNPETGMNEATWSALVDDTSNDGLDCTDEELADFLRVRGALETLPGVQPSAEPTPAPAPQDVATMTRDQLKAAVFRLFDKDSDDLLGRSELRLFAEKTGFSGSDEEWSSEYDLICRDMHASPSVGIDEASFGRLVDDDSDTGCYCSDEELREMLDAGAANASAERSQPLDDVKPRQAENEGERNGKGKTKADTTTAKGGKGVSQAPATPEGVDADPWASQVDPWATPGAQRVHQKQMSKGKGVGKDDRNAAAGGKHDQDRSNAAQDTGEWEKWKEVQSKPAMNVEALLEASRAANAARKAKEAKAKEEEEKQALMDKQAELLAEFSEGKKNIHSETREDEEEDTELPDIVAGGASSSRSGPRSTTTGAALSKASTAIARLSEGDPSAASELVNAVAGAPNSYHILAVATSAVRALLQGKLNEAKVLLSLQEMILDPGSGEAALLFALGELGRHLGPAGVPFLLRPLLAALGKVGDKQGEIRAAAIAATEGIVKSVSAFAFEALLPTLTAAMDCKRAPPLKLHALRLLAICWRSEGEESVAHKLPQLLPVATNLLLDTNNDVRSASNDAVEVLLALCGNSDLQPHLEEILGCAKGKKDVAQCIRNLAEVVFVQQVEARALAVVMPVLVKGLRNRNPRTQRQASIIAENMCRLVPSVADVEPFTPQLLPLLKRISEEAADPDVREVAGRAHSSLSQVADAGVSASVRHELRTALAVAVSMAEADVNSPAGGDGFTPCPAHVRDVVIDYLVTLCVGLGNCRVEEERTWRTHLKPFLEALAGVHAEGLADKLRVIGRRLSASRSKANADMANDEESDEDDSRRLLCDVTFTLACGAATLLSSARLRLVRNRVYGLVGANDSGKSAILRAIHNRQVKELPPPGELVSSLVEHGVGEKPPECDWTPSQYLLADPIIKKMGLAENHIRTTLQSLGFEEGGRLKKPISTLSGGWKMKLSLARAVVQAADMVLLDEPTGHLDQSHVDWLVNYIQSLTSHEREGSTQRQGTEATIVIVSHDASFLDQVCTHIIHVQGQKLATYKGNFSEFIARVPDAQLGSASGEQEQPLSKFMLPEPGMLEGVRSRGKRFLYMENAVYTYPGNSAPSIRGATVECSLRSRIAIVGPNGAGKSTLAGLVVGELLPDLGTVWRHPNLRVAYVAQHTFHHLEQHLDLTATQYILWRFAGHEDREALDFRAEEVEQGQVKAYRLIGEQLVQCDAEDDDRAEPEMIAGRRQRGRLGYEYEVRWHHPRNAANSWVPRAQLIAMGHQGMVKREDEREAAQRALVGRALTTPGVEAHLTGFGLDAEEATHRRLGALSNGQRARVVLGAATWLAPHLLVLDEPSNYLDRPALAALSIGLQSFGGGLIAISHNLEFLDEVCTERWLMSGGVLKREGAPVDAGPSVTDAAAKAASAASAAAKEAKDKRKQKRLRDLRRKNGEDVASEDDDWYEDLLKKANKIDRARGMGG